MDKYWQVALTYLYRPRLLIAGGLYVATSWWWGSNVAFDLRVTSFVEFACILSSFIALHVRRQLGTSDRRVVPGYPLPHLAVAALASMLVWVAVPWIQAELTGAKAWQLIAPHAVAGLFLTLVAVWPKAIALLAASPVVVVWMMTARWESRSSFLLRFLEGQEPAWSWALIVLTVLAHPLAAYVLLRQSEQGLAANDDFSIESVRPDRPLGRWESLLLASRDASVERRLSAVRGRWWAIARWRIPVVVSWVQLALVTLCVTATMALAEYAGPGNIVLATMIVGAVMLIMPFGPWNARRHAIAMEFVRPVTRAQLFRGLAGALALDVCLWTALASAICAAGLVIGIQRESKEAYFGIVIVYLLVLWVIALWLYGISLLTLRFRYWIPLIVISGAGWVLGSIVLFEWVHSHFRQAFPSPVNPLEWAFLTAGAGLLLAWFAYRRSLEADLA